MPEWGDMEEAPEAAGRPAANKVNCFLCVHFKVTWDKARPKGCALFGFVCQEMPSELVRKSLGASCPGFTPKKAKR